MCLSMDLQPSKAHHIMQTRVIVNMCHVTTPLVLPDSQWQGNKIAIVRR